MDNGLQWTPIGEKPSNDENELGWFAKSFQHCSGPSRKCPTTDFAAIPFSLAIVNRDSALMGQTTCTTRRIGTKLKGRIHGFCCCFHIHRMPANASFFKSHFLPFHHLAGFYHIIVRRAHHNETFWLSPFLLFGRATHS